MKVQNIYVLKTPAGRHGPKYYAIVYKISTGQNKKPKKTKEIMKLLDYLIT